MLLYMNRTPIEKKVTFAEYLTKPAQILQLVRASIYVFFGGYLFTQAWFLNGYPIYKYAFCGLAVVYGLFRWYRIYADYKLEQS
jgi:hypothetical protein